jgi:hypothetical protein
MSKLKQFSSDEARRIGGSLGIDWSQVDLEEFRMGLFMEHEYVTRAPGTSVTDDDMILAGRIALAYLIEHPNYYTRLATVEAEADKQYANNPEYA